MKGMFLLKIRTANVTDSDAILSIYAPFITDTFVSFETEVPSSESFKKRVAAISNGYPFFVCEENGEVLGYAYASAHGERAAYYLSVNVSVYISPSHHGKGIGKALYIRLLDELSRRGFHRAYAAIALPNEKSIKLHTSLGFTHVGTFHEAGYKFRRWIDLAWYEKGL